MRIRRYVAGLVAALVMGMVGAVAVAAPASAASVGPVRIVHSASGLCVGAPMGSSTWYAAMSLAPCGSRYFHQQYYLDETGLQPWQFYIRNSYNWLCADVGSWRMTPEAPIVQYGCTHSANQRFLVAFATPYERKLQVEHSGMCARVGYAYTGAPLVQGYCNDQAALWWFQNV